jgi:hypothetical protein
MRKPAAVVLLCCAVVLFVALPASARKNLEEMTTAEAINAAYEERAIDHPRMMLLKAYAVYSPDRLPVEYRGGVGDRCGLSFAEELTRALEDGTLPGEVEAEIRGLRARPNCMTYIDTDHFRIHYDTSGTHKVYGWPSTTFRDWVMTRAEEAWEAEVVEWGFRQPPADGGDPDGGGGNDKYDIYLQNLGSGLYGYCQGSYYVPATPQNDVTSYVVIDNDFLGYGGNQYDLMKITVAHEFGHAVQNAHNVSVNTWYKECTSMWAEETLYSEVNDYIGYIPWLFNKPYESLDWDDPTGMRKYGSIVWNIFLTEYVDEWIVPSIWDEYDLVTPEYIGMQSRLADFGLTLEEVFVEFCVWNWFTGWRDDANHYREGAMWPVTHTTEYHNNYPISGETTFPGWRPDHMAANYVQFNNPGTGETGLHIHYDGPALISMPNAAHCNCRSNAGHTAEVGPFELNPWGNGDLTINGFNDLEYVTMVVVNPTQAQEEMLFSFDAELVETGIEDESYVFGMKPASPNPFVETTAIAYTVPTGGGLVEVTIYDVNGREVRNLVNERKPGGAGEAVWDGLDNRGNRVGAGVYFARLDVDGLTASGKLMVLK